MCLRAVAQHDNKADKDTVGMSSYSAFVQHSEHLYSALKHLAEEGTTTRNVVLSTPQEDGFLAWWSLNSTFTQALAGRQGSVMSQFTAAHAKPAKNTVETKAKLIVVDNAIKNGRKSWANMSQSRCSGPPM